MPPVVVAKTVAFAPPLQETFVVVNMDEGSVKGVEKLFTMAPGEIQLEVAPVNAKLVTVPVLEFPETSVSEVTVVLLSLAYP